MEDSKIYAIWKWDKQTLTVLDALSFYFDIIFDGDNKVIILYKKED
jgi:hypothetical protein